MHRADEKSPPKPPWLRVSMARSEAFGRVSRILREDGLHTVCEEADCPNIHECYSAGTATFLIMGDTCTRRCGFCAVTTLAAWSGAKPPTLLAFV